MTGSWVYLGICVAAALITANAWRPFSRRTAASVPAWFVGMPTSEFPVPILVLQAALTAAAGATGLITGTPGVVGAVLTAGSWIGLAGLAVVAHRADRVLTRALVDALGQEYPARVVRPPLPTNEPLPSRAPSALRVLRIRKTYARDADLAYGPDPQNVLDIWRHERLPRDGKAPVLVQIPGGAWVTGNKQGQAYPLMSHLAERGWICVALSYRLSPKATWPAEIVDVKRAISWVKTNIAAYGGDPDFVVLSGGSAGGHLSSLAALTPGDPDFQPGFEAADTSVRAAVPFYGAYDWTNRDGTGHHTLVPFLERWVVKQKLADAPAVFAQASPMSRVGPAAPPMFVIHGRNDSLIPVEPARLFVRLLRAASPAPVPYAELPQAQHAFDLFGAPRARRCANAVESFLGTVYCAYLHSRNASRAGDRPD